MGRIHYDDSNPYGCDGFVEDLTRSADITPFYMAKRGECSFVQKVRHMESIGVAVGIVIDDRREMTDATLMSDDGTGGGIRIPSMLISKDDGQILIDWFKRASSAEKNQLVIMAEFEVTH